MRLCQLIYQAPLLGTTGILHVAWCSDEGFEERRVLVESLAVPYESMLGWPIGIIEEVAKALVLIGESKPSEAN